jgi:hypothetical protein
MQRLLVRQQINFSRALSRTGTSISVVLIEKVENRGESGEIVKVKRGFARNFLIPRKLAGNKSINNNRIN